MITFIPVNKDTPVMAFDTEDDVKDYVSRNYGIKKKEVIIDKIMDNAQVCIASEGHRDYIAWCGYPKVVGQIEYE